jgi:hypothetical protein
MRTQHSATSVRSRSCANCGRPRTRLEWCARCWKRVSDLARQRGKHQSGDRVQRLEVDYRDTRRLLRAWDALRDEELRLQRKYKPGTLLKAKVEPADLIRLLDALVDLQDCLIPAIRRSKESLDIENEMRRSARTRLASRSDTNVS